MSDGLFSTVELGSGGTGAGYRLRRIEVFNWGTFDRRVWRLTVDGDTALLTGDIGSGKSTMVDAITTLLVPAQRISYNKAAGAESKERTLRSYVEGHYKTQRSEDTGTSRPVALRDQQSYSVILGVFTNDGYDETVTIAQVFHQRASTGQPDRFYVTSDKDLSIEADFSDFGSDLADLRKRLRGGGAEVHTVFPDYGRAMRRLLGIRSEQALELFHQTVSMKSVGNLNAFVRDHMLEPADAATRIREIVLHFEDLTKAHEAVTRARAQLDALGPLVETATRYEETVGRRDGLIAQRNSVRLFIAELRIDLLEAELAQRRSTREELARSAAATEANAEALRHARDALISERAAAGGDRVTTLEQQASHARQQESERRQRRADFDGFVSAAGLDIVGDGATFAAGKAAIELAREQIDERQQELQATVHDAIAATADLRREGDNTRAELTSLAARSNNIPTAQLAVRAQLCSDLDIDESELPFAGELLDVAERYAEWRGAAERALRGLALSLLVGQQHYDSVSRWVNDHRLTYRRNDGSTAGSRLVYERVPARQIPLQPRGEDGRLLLGDTIDIADGPFAGYLRHELLRRADHVCADTIEQFRDEHRAVTRQGQMRSGGRHEKDDRSRVDDPRSWVLGWANQRKIDALTEHMVEIQRQLTAAEERNAALQNERRGLASRGEALTALGLFRSWAELDWAEAQARAEALDAERERLVAGSSVLAEIDQRLADNDARTAETRATLDRLNGDVRVEDDRIRTAERARETDSLMVAAVPDADREAARARYADLSSRLGPSRPATAADCSGAMDSLTADLNTGIDRANSQVNGYSTRLVQFMADVRRRWPEATSEMDASVEARSDFRAFHDQVAGDDLPRFEAEFKRQLNTNTIRELAQFNNWLRRQSEDIHARVDRINEALGAIDYNPGEYITLDPERTPNTEIHAFRTDLRAATDDTLSADDDHYSEQRFLDVQRIIDRFRGREGHTESDKAWTARVTDVRNWFTFSASVRSRETDAESERFDDSDGKSGGQKEKLAYTILAASLAYQFGLEWGAPKSRDFRFAVIDEAFGRGSDASTRYALTLFARLGLQLLIVTPLQKVHVIEPYVHAIGFVDNPTGSYSQILNMTIEEFRARRSNPPA